MIHFGFHASAGGNIEKLPLEAKKLGGECFQFFSRSPYGGKVTPLDPQKVVRFKENCRKTGIKNYYIHSPYFINLASRDNRIFYGSIKAIKDDLERAKVLGAKFVITHIGSAKDYKIKNDLFSAKNRESVLPPKYKDFLEKISEERGFSPEAFGKVIKGLQEICKGEKFVSPVGSRFNLEPQKVPLLIEIAAGAGAILVEKIEEIAYYLAEVPALAGFCLDTAHAFASGYKFDSQEGRSEIFALIEKFMGKEKLCLMHINDSSSECGSRIDRHAHLGEGKIGRESFQNLIQLCLQKKYNLDMILETPTIKGVLRDLELLKRYRNN